MKNIEQLKELVADFPDQPGVYVMKDVKTKTIYIGKAKNLRSRVRSYFQKNYEHSLKTKFLVSHIDHIDYILTKTEVEAYLLEASLIKKLKPRYNIRLKDDKAYPYIQVSVLDEFPRFYLARKVRHDGSLYFGPYTSASSVRETLKFLNSTFKIRDCSDAFMASRKRPCLSYQIGRCTAPCVGFIDKMNYQAEVDLAVGFLRGRDKNLIKDLTTRMKSAADNERFETAAKLRDSLNAVQDIWQKQRVVNHRDVNQDVVAYVGDERGTLIETLHVRAGRVIGNRSHYMPRFHFAAPGEDERDWLTSFLNQYYVDNFLPEEIILQTDLGGDIVKLLRAVFYERHGQSPQIIQATGIENKKLLEMALTNAEAHFKDHASKKENIKKALEDIQVRFALPRLPQRIECFDISNFQGSENVASQVVFEDGLPKKDDYRLYKIKSVVGANDFASMKEVLSRRLNHDEYERPDLLVVDGGKGQLKMALEALKELNHAEIPVVSIAKARTQGKFEDANVITSEERFFLPGRHNPVTLSTHSEAYQILVALRDEAHRFAIQFHRKLRDHRTLQSQLDEVTGLGEKKKQLLLKTYGTIEVIRKASVEDLMQLKGFSRLLAERIFLAIAADESS